jgi:hypothetical protein
MKASARALLLVGMLGVFLGCASLRRYEQADLHKERISSLALLPLIIGGESGKVEKLSGNEVFEFVTYFDSRFYDDFQREIQLIDAIQLKLPGRDFNMDRFSITDYFSVARTIGADALLGIDLTLYNEVKPGAKGAQIAAAVVTTLLLGGYVKENQIVGYQTHFAYLDIEKVDEGLSFEFRGRTFPTIEEQRAFFVESLIRYLDTHFPLSSDYVKAYKH